MDRSYLKLPFDCVRGDFPIPLHAKQKAHTRNTVGGHDDADLTSDDRLYGLSHRSLVTRGSIRDASEVDVQTTRVNTRVQRFTADSMGMTVALSKEHLC